MLENRKKRVYKKPDQEKVNTLKDLKKSGYGPAELQTAAYQLFGRNVSSVTIWKWTR